MMKEKTLTMIHKAKQSLVIAIIACLGVSVSAQASTLEMISDLGTSARTLAVGNILGVESDASAVFENPARLGTVESSRTSMFYTMLADQESMYYNAAHVTSLFGLKIGIGAAQKMTPGLDYTELNGLTQRQKATGTFDVTDRLIKVGLSLPITSFMAIGSSFHYATMSMHDFEGSGMNIDLGATLDVGPFLGSFMMTNFMSSQKMTYNLDVPSADFPTQYVGSGEFRLTDSIGVLGQVKMGGESERPLMSFGVEFSPGIGDFLHFYGGRSELMVSGTKQQRITGGIGLNLSSTRVQFVYSQTDYAASGGMYGFSVSF